MRFLYLVIFISTLIYGQDIFTKTEQEWINKHQNIKIAMLNNFQPFSYVENNKHKGLCVELLSEISKISGLTFDMQPSRWSDALGKFKNQEVDMISGISHTSQREEFTLFTKPYYEIPTFIFGMKRDKSYKNNQSLQNKKVGVSKNIFYINTLQDQGIDVIQYDSSVNKAKALVTGEIDYFLASYTSGIKAIVDQSLSTIKPLDELTSIKKEDLRYGINKNNPILHSIIEKSLASIDKSYFLYLSKKWVVYNNDATTPLNFTEAEKTFIQNSKPIQIGSMDSYIPFSFLQDEKKVGLTQDIIKVISQKSGLQFIKSGGTWPELYDKFKNKKIDIISEISHNKERESFSLFTKPYFEIPIGVFTRDDFGSYEGLNSLINKKVVILKNSYLKNLIKDIKGIKIVEVNKNNDKLLLLNNKKVDVALSSTLNTYKIEKLMLQNIKLAGVFSHPKSKAEDLRFGINKDKPLLASIINKTLDSIPFSHLTQLKQKWIYQTTDKQTIQPSTLDKILTYTQKEKEYLKNNPIVTYSEVNWKPLSIIENNQMRGIMGDYLDIVSKRTGLQFKFIPSDSWPHVLKQFQEKKIDLVPGIGTSPQETKLGLISNSYAKYPMVIVTGKEYKFLDSLTTLKDKTIAVPKHYTSYNFLIKQYPQIKLITTKNIPEALLLVESGKADAFVGHIATSLFYLSELHLDNLKISGMTNFTFEHRYLIQDNNPILRSIINKAFDSITELERKNIYEKWIQTTVSEKSISSQVLLLLLVMIFLIILYFAYKQHILKKSIEETNELIDATMEAMVISKKGIITNVNQSAVDLLGYSSKQELKNIPLIDFIADSSKEIVKTKLQENDTEPYEGNILKKNGTSFPALLRGHTMTSQGLRVSSLIDLTKLKQLEAQTKLASMGEMIANISHQWRQPLSVISTAATGMKFKKEMNVLEDNEFYDACDHINENTQYLSQTIDDFRNFIRGDTKVVKFNLKKDTNSFTKIIDSTLKVHCIKLILDLEEHIELKGYPNELIQCFINIFNNAKDAFLENEIEEGERYIFITQKIKGDEVIITFKDNAGGIPKNVISKIFDPYFTTKHKSQGTGLGLHMSYNLIVNHMNGSIKACNETYEFNKQTYTGAKFIITLPFK